MIHIWDPLSLTEIAHWRAPRGHRYHPRLVPRRCQSRHRVHRPHPLHMERPHRPTTLHRRRPQPRAQRRHLVPRRHKSRVGQQRPDNKNLGPPAPPAQGSPSAVTPPPSPPSPGPPTVHGSLSGSLDHTVKIWDTLTGAQTLTLESGNAAVYALSVRPDGLAIAVDRRRPPSFASSTPAPAISPPELPRQLPMIERRSR